MKVSENTSLGEREAEIRAKVRRRQKLKKQEYNATEWWIFCRLLNFDLDSVFLHFVNRSNDLNCLKQSELLL